MTPRTPASRLLIAAFVSLGLHAALMAGGWLRPPAMTAQRNVLLEARLVPLAPAPPPPAARSVQPPRTPRTRTPQRDRRAVVPAQPQPVEPRVAAAPVPPSYESADEEAEAPGPDSAAAPAPEPRAAALMQAERAQEPEVPSVKTLPRKGRIRYTAYLGADGFTVGKTVQTWEVDAEGYKLGSISETTGIVDLFRAQRHIYLSEGRFTARGLQPEKFFMSRTRRGRTEAAQALFDWEGGRLTLGRVPEKRGAALPPDAQDIVSFMYQLALSPPAPGRMRLPITNGSRFETYDIDVLEEERIETPLGVLRALPIRQLPRPGAESVAIWLAVDYRHLPVKIRFFDRDGRAVGEQVVEQIEISDE